MYTTWQRSVHSVPGGERTAAAVTFRNVQIGDCTAPWPGDTALPGTRALAVRCRVVNASIGVFVSPRVLSPTSNGVKSIKETLNVSNQNTIRGSTAVRLYKLYIGTLKKKSYPLKMEDRMRIREQGIGEDV